MATRVTMSVQGYNATTGEIEAINISSVNPVLFDTTDTAKLQAAYEFVDAAARALCSLSTNTYRDTIISNTVSVTEELNA